MTANLSDDLKEGAKSRSRSAVSASRRRSLAWFSFLASDAASYVTGQTIVATAA